MKDKEKLLETVRRLFNLADTSRNNSDEEAKSAMLKAQELMAKYGLTLEDISEENKPEYSHEMCETKWNYGYRTALATVISENFRCRCYIAGKSVYMVGHPADARIAKSTFEFAYQYIMREGNSLYNKRYQMKMPTKGVFNSYAIGFILGLKESLEKQCRALKIITPSDVNDYFENMTQEWETRPSKIMNSRLDASSFKKGISDGNSFMEKTKLEER